MKHLVILVIGLAALTTWPAGAADAEEASAAPSLAAILDECSGMHLAAEARVVKDKSVQVGHMEIAMNDGTAAPVLGKSGSVLGFYFEGRGGYLYTTVDPADRDALAMNVARTSNSLRAIAGRVSDDFKRVLVLFGEPEFADVCGGPDSAAAVPSEPLAAGFKATVSGAMTTYGEFEFRTALVRLNGEGRWIYAELAGGVDRVGYVYDGSVYGWERLFGFRQVADYARFTETMSDQPLSDRSSEDRTAVVLVHADLSVATEDNKSGSIDTDATFRVRRAGTRLLSLSLINHVDPDARNWDTHRHTLRVKRILDADGHERTFSHKYGELVVEIAPTAAADTDVRLRFETGGEIFVDMSGYHTDNYFALQGFPWYPSPPLWAGQRFTYTLKAKVKKPWRPVTSGREVSLRDEGPFVVAEARSDRPAMQIAVMGGKYFTHAETIEGITVRVHSYAWNRKTVLEKMPRLAVALIKVYENMLGPIAINELDIVEVPSFGFGIAPSGMVLITSEAYADIHDEFASGINARLAHEIAHQWFGHKAVPIAISDNWLAESFAEYFAGVAMGMIAAKEKTVYGFNDMLIEWRADGKNCTTGGTIATANYLGGRDGYRDRRCLLYSRGPLVLQMLRTSIGNDRFAAATRKYLDAADGGPVTTDDYAKAVSDVVQMDMRWYFDQWVRRSGNAAVDVDKHVDPAEGGQYRLWGTIRQTPGTGFKKLLVPLVWESGGKTEARVVFADQPEKKFEFMLPTKPGVIKPDPFQNNLAVYK